VTPADCRGRSWVTSWCVSHQLQPGALRSSVACPLCTFVIEGL
jgi:hypothetical protein